MFQRAVESYVTDNFRDRRAEVGRSSIYKHLTQGRYHLVTTFRLECDYEEICERDRQTNMNGFLFQQHRPIFALNPESYLSTTRDIKAGQHSQLPLHPAVPLHVDGFLHLFFGRPNLFLLPTGMCAVPNLKIRASLMLSKCCAYVYKCMTSPRYHAMQGGGTAPPIPKHSAKWSNSRSGRFTPGEKSPGSIVQNAELVPGTIWTGVEKRKCVPTWVRTPNPTAHRK
jgi:hypothetical protein